MHRLVECVGLPGAGKSTLCSEYAKTGEWITETWLAQAWRNSSPFAKAGIAFASLAEFGLWWAIVRLVARHGLWKKTDSLYRLAKLPAQRLWLRRNLRRGSLLLDQGGLQTLWSALISSDVASADDDLLTALVRQFYRDLPVDVVSFELAADAAAQRVASRTERKNSRFDHQPADQVARRLRRFEVLLGQVVSASRRAGLSVHALDAGRDTPALCKQMATELDYGLHIAYVFMRFPSPREAFAHAELNALARAGHRLSIFTLLGEHPRGRRLLADRGPVGVEFQAATSARILSGLWQMSKRPVALCRTLVWLLRNSGARPRHLLKSLAVLPRLFDVLAQLERMRPDVVHLFWGHYPATLLYLAGTVGLPGKRTMFMGAYDMNTRWPGSAAAARAADRVFTHAECNLPALNDMGIPRDKIAVVYRGIDLTLKAPDVERSPCSLLAAGALIASKRHDLAITVLADLVKQGKDAYLTLCGEGPERNALQLLADNLGVGSRVRLTGHLGQAELFREMAAHRYFILLSEHLSERLPNVAKEAMAHGCVVLTTDTEGIAELVETGVSGFVVGKGDTQTVVDEILMLEAHPDRRARMARAAQQTIAERFDAARNVDAYLNIWR